MLVKRECVSKLKLFYQNLAGAVCEAPLFVMVAAEDLPGIMNILFGQVDNPLVITHIF